MMLGFVGLGRMGKPMVLNLLRKGHRVVAYTPRNVQALRDVESKGAIAVRSLAEIPLKLSRPRIIYLEIPAGDPVENAINELTPLLESGDILIDGGNSFFKDSMRRAQTLKEKGVYYLDVGTSGGQEGAEKGLCLMVGGDETAYNLCEPIFEALAAPGAYTHVGESGAGHFVKMCHNGVLYAMLEAYGEGFAMLHSAPFKLKLDQIADIWRKGSVVRSWLLDLAYEALKKDPELKEYGHSVGGGETGTWAVETAHELNVPTPCMAMALQMRYISRLKELFSGKVIAALRYEFGGHEYKRPE
ncbi:MAG: decarboxylating 6-phosphogluconate dehydrogenase [Candidatus Bathyarchaeia archaeon]